MLLFLWLFFSISIATCIDVLNANPTAESFMVNCTESFPMVFPTSCSCGTVPLFSFSTLFSYLECFCNTNFLQYGYARAFCCNNSALIMNYDMQIDRKVRALNQKLSSIK